MKTLLLSILLFIATNGMAQTKGDNTIIFHQSISVDNIKSLLFTNGYALSGTDTAYITTSVKELSNAPIAIKFMISKKDSVTYFRALYKPTISFQFGSAKTESDFEQLSFIGEKRGPIKKAWYEMERITKLLSNSISYTKQ